MDKFKYIQKQFSRANRKTLELYITTRIWHKLDRLDVEFITQQPVKGNKLYFTDIFFPQIKLHIEIDEGYHKKPSQEELDQIRQADIINITNHEIIRIDATLPVEDVNKQVDVVVQRINNFIKELGEKFEPWDGLDKNSSYYINKGYMDCKENVLFRRIVDACSCFGLNYKGMQKAYAKHPIEKDCALWFPQFYENGLWNNSISEDDSVIKERYIGSKYTNKQSVENNIHDLRKKRLVFARVKSPLGWIMYRFIGVYELDVEASLKEECSIYRKISDVCKTYSYSSENIL